MLASKSQSSWRPLSILVLSTVLLGGVSLAVAQVGDGQPADGQTAAVQTADVQDGVSPAIAQNADVQTGDTQSPAVRTAELQTTGGQAAAPLAPVQAIDEASPQGRLIADVQIEGLVNVPEAFVRARLRTRAGTTYDEAEVRADLRRLIESGRLAAADATYQITDQGQVAVTFRVQEKSVLSQIQFEGNERVSTKDLLAAVGLEPGQPADLFQLRQAVEMIEDYYREQGYQYAEVTLDEQLLQSQGIALFNIVEGPRVKVRRIVFEGNESFPASRLTGVLETKTYIWIFRKGAYDPEAVARDETNIANFYREQGYLDVRVGHRLEFAPNREDLTLVFLIDEGQQYTIGEIVFEGNTVLSDDELRAMMRLGEGSPLLQEVLQADLRAIRDAYGSRGYIYANVTAEPTFLPEPNQVRLTVRLEEGPQITVDEVIIRGNEQTQDKVIRRHVTLLPGETYDATAQKQIQQRLYETQLFEDVEVTPAGGRDDTRDVLVRVKEANTTQFIVGAGITSNNGLMGNITIENRNFDIGDWPQSAGEFFRGRSFKGAGQIFRLQLEPGTELTRFRVSFREPYLLDKPISLGTSAYIYDRDRVDYTEGRTGFTVSLGKRLASGILKDWSVEGAGRWEFVDIGGVRAFDPRDYRDMAGDSYLSTLKISLLRDRTDSAWFPTMGDRLLMSYEQAGVFGGDWTFGKLMSSYNWYRTLRTDVFDRKTVWANRLTSGYILGNAPVFERFFGGGIGSIRGFKYRGVTPRQGYRDQPVGGEYMLLAGTELSFPLFGKELRGVTFLDMGTVEDDFGISNWRASIGFGVRFVVRLFGPVPMSFDFGIPIAKQSEDDTQVFSFSLGTAF